MIYYTTSFKHRIKKSTTLGKKIQIKKKRSNAISWAVFIGTIEIVLISLTSVIFPALIVRNTSRIVDTTINPWETGVWALPLVLTNIILLGIGIAYYKNKLPKIISKSFKFIFNFEVSKKVAFITIVVLLTIYIPASIGELNEDEGEKWADFAAVNARTDSWKFEEITQFYDLHFRFFLLSSSIDLFENIRVIPFIASIALLILTYFITMEMSQKRFAGLVAFTILLQSPVFLEYDTTATYENFWTVLYILSLYLIYKAWQLSPVSYILSLFSKPLTAAFLPMTLFFIYRSNLPRKRKIRTFISYIIIVIMGIAALMLFDISLLETTTDFADLYFWQGFTSMSYQLRFDFLVLLFLLPLTVGLFFASRRGILQADSIMVLIAGILFSAPILTGFTTLTNQPYRFVPLVVFFAMGVGILLSKRQQKITERA